MMSHRRTRRRLAVAFIVLAGAALAVWLATRDDDRVIEVAGCQDILDLFDELDYRADTWKEQDVPRIAFTCSPAHWCSVGADDSSVQFRKSMFLMTTAPLVLMANEETEARRRTIAGARHARARLKEMALRYDVIGDRAAALTPVHLAELRRRVDTVPPSLALAQGAEESGWGTSRFVLEGNALFGQMVWDESGMEPNQARRELGPYGVRKFRSLLDSTRAYVFNLNTHRAYNGFRTLRAVGQASVGELAGELEHYSERRGDYVVSLRTIIRANGLELLDGSRLADGPTWIVAPDC